MPSLKDRIKKLFQKKETDSSQPTAQLKPEEAAPSQKPTQQPTSQQTVVSPFATQENTQQQPVAEQRATSAMTPAPSSGMLTVLLQNQSSSSNVYAYITGTALDHNNALFLLQSDARTAYYPASPSANGTVLAQNVSIPLGAPGNTVTATIPRLAGGRIWMSIDAPLVFHLNPGPGLVEPSVFNPSDPNVNINFGFAEFTYNSSQVFANISYVDFVGAPISLTLTDATGTTQHVSGLPANGLDTICNGLKAQTAKDNRHWSSLIITKNGQNLRALSPNSGILLNPTWFDTLFTDYVNQVYSTYTTKLLTVDTQAGYGNVNGETNTAGALNFGTGGTFAKPSSKDIFSCSTGPFATGSNAETNVIIPRLAAAFNRGTLLLPTGNSTPNGTAATQYYTGAATNHYARIVHAANLDGKGYAFPYDDVTPDGGVPQEGAVFSSNAVSMTLAVGGNNAYAQN